MRYPSSGDAATSTGTPSESRPNPRKRVGDDVALDRKLPVVRDVAVGAAAAQRIGHAGAAIGRRLVDLDRLAEGDALGDSVDARAHALAWNRPAHQHDAAVDASDHAAAGGGFLYVEGDDRSCREHRAVPNATASAGSRFRVQGSGFKVLGSLLPNLEP